MTADTFSNTLGYLQMGTGNDNNTWGNNANTAVFQVFEDAIANALSSAVSGGTLDLSGSPPPTAASQVRYAALVFTGVLGSNQVVQVPNLTKFWWVKNATSGSFSLKMKTPAGAASAAIPQNSGYQLVLCDGANNIVVTPFNSNQIQMPDGSLGAPAFSNVNETNSGWRRAGTQDWRFTINGVDVLQITGSGAGTPSVVNILSPNTLQVNGASLFPTGMEAAFAGIELPSGWLWEDGSAYNRAVQPNLFGAITKAATGDTHFNTTIDNLSVDLRGKGLEGAFIEGSNITTGTTIVSVDSATALTLSLPTGSILSGVALRILPYGQGDGLTTFNVPDRRYRALIGRDNMNNNPAGRSSTFAGTHLSTAGGEEGHTLITAEIPSHTHTATVTDPGHVHAQQSGTVINAGASVLNLAGGGTAGNSNASATALATTGITVGNAITGGSGSHNNMQPFGICNYIIKA